MRESCALPTGIAPPSSVWFFYLNVNRGGTGGGANHQEAGRGDGREGEPYGDGAEAGYGVVR